MKSLWFLPALYWNQQSCFSVGNVRISNKRLLGETRVFIASKLDCVKCQGLIYCMTIFLKTTFGWSAVKNNPDFVPPVMTFRTATSVIDTVYDTRKHKLGKLWTLEWLKVNFEKWLLCKNVWLFLTCERFHTSNAHSGHLVPFFKIDLAC